MIEIKYLADYPELIPLLSSWFFDEWGKNNSTLTMNSINAALRQRTNHDKLPLCLIAFMEKKPAGTVALKIREMETRPQYEHWLGNVYVLPEYRKQGIGTNLIKDAIYKAERIGINELYLYTRDREKLYSKIGWKTIEQVEYRGRKATLMKHVLVK